MSELSLLRQDESRPCPMCGGAGELRVAQAPPVAEMADRLQHAITARGFTQVQVAEAIGVTQSSISRWINGRRRPSYDDLFALASLLEVRVDWLLGADITEATA